MVDWIRVTAEYSNAVLVAIFPYISDFVRKAELPVSTPFSLQQVAQFKCYPKQDDTGGLVILTNDLRIWYYHGYVNGFRTPRSYYNLQDPKTIPSFYGPLNMSKDEALQFARLSVLKLGYTLQETFMDQEPVIDMPSVKGTNIVPHYRFEWRDPVFSATAVSIEVDAGKKLIQEMWLLSPFLWRVPPKVSLRPKAAELKRPISLITSNEFLAKICPKISDFARKVELPIRLPVTQEQIARVEFVHFDSDVRIRLTNGYWFESWRGVVEGFSAPDTVYGRQPPALEPFPRPLQEYLGRWNLSEKESIELVRRTIKKLGYTMEDFHADRAPEIITKPDQVGTYVVPRHSFRWMTNDPATRGTIAMIRAEVDADKGRLKHLELLGDALSAREQSASERPNPKVERTAKQRIFFDTNAVQAWRPEDFDPAQRPSRTTNQVTKPSPSASPRHNPYE